MSKEHSIVNGSKDVRDAQEQGITQDITICYNPATQAVTVKFDPKQYRSFEFVLGVIEMGRLAAAQMRETAQQMQAMQQMQQMQLAAQNEKILRGR